MTDQLDVTTATPTLITETDATPVAVAPFNWTVLTGLVVVVLSVGVLALVGGQAAAALVCVALAVVGAVLCAVGWEQAVRRGGRGWEPAVATVGILLALGWIAALFLVSRAHGTIARGNCLTNQREISLALTMYTQDYGRFPPDWATAQAFTEKTLPKSIGKALWVCEARNWLDPHPAHRGYGMNAALAGRAANTLAEPATLLLTADAHAADGLIRSPADIDRNRHGGTYVLSYADGSARIAFRTEPVRLQP